MESSICLERSLGDTVDKITQGSGQTGGYTERGAGGKGARKRRSWKGKGGEGRYSWMWTDMRRKKRSDGGVRVLNAC